MAEPRSRNNRKRVAKAKAVARQPWPEPDDAPESPVATVAVRARGDMGGWMAMLLAASGLAFVGFLTVLLVVAASRA